MANNTGDRPTYLAQVLTNYRKINKLSQEDVAERLGITRSAYAYYELGKTEPSTENLRLLAKLYAAPIDDFFQPDKESDMRFSDNSMKIVSQQSEPKYMGELSSDERKLIALFRVADISAKRKIIREIQNVVTGKNNKD